MKLFNVDMSKRYIIGSINGAESLLSFDYSLFKGITNINISKGKETIDSKLESTYPPLKEIIHQILVIYFPMWLKTKWHNHWYSQ